MRTKIAIVAASLFMLVAAPLAQAQDTAPITNEAKLTLKRKVAISRFSNSTNYGKALLLPGENDPRTTQATDALMSRLTEAGTFILFDNEIASKINGGDAKATNGIDAVIVGSITELGRRAEGKAGFLNSNIRQVATAKVDIRLIDAKSGVSFFSTSGTGTAFIEAKEVAGFGAVSSYDSSLIDKAISAAIADTASNIIQKLNNRSWSTDILTIQNSKIYISGGEKQGLKKGQILAVEEKGQQIVSGQTGSTITLPGKQIARISINEFFGDTEFNEGSIATVIEGTISDKDISKYIVKEMK